MKKLVLISIALTLILVLISGCIGGSQTGNDAMRVAEEMQMTDELHREIEALRSELNAVQNYLDKARETIAELTMQIETQKNVSSSMRQIFPPRECGALESEADTPEGRTFEITLPTRDQVIDGMAGFASDVIDFSNDINESFRNQREERQNP